MGKTIVSATSRIALVEVATLSGCCSPEVSALKSRAAVAGGVARACMQNARVGEAPARLCRASRSGVLERSWFLPAGLEDPDVQALSRSSLKVSVGTIILRSLTR